MERSAVRRVVKRAGRLGVRKPASASSCQRPSWHGPRFVVPMYACAYAYTHTRAHTHTHTHTHTHIHTEASQTREGQMCERARVRVRARAFGRKILCP